MSEAEIAKLCTTNIRLIYNKPIREQYAISYGGRGQGWSRLSGENDLLKIKQAAIDWIMDNTDDAVEMKSQLKQFKLDWDACKDDEERKTLAAMLMEEDENADDSESEDSESENAEDSEDEE